MFTRFLPFTLIYNKVCGCGFVARRVAIAENKTATKAMTLWLCAVSAVRRRRYRTAVARFKAYRIPSGS
ncbi:hypothetical protein [Prevotella intermedia]|uniref:hypothetical protein n=1 Tax=Prevotella intermedia TaxID=28131 RepID=UPI001C54F153|nr:hypothetical protein [Prevotella intermedia]